MVIRDPFEKPVRKKDPLKGLAVPFDRLAAHVADLVILAPLMALAMAPFRRATMESRLLGDTWATDIAVFKGLAAAVAIGVLWEALFVAFWGATPGRLIFGLRVVDVWTGKKPRPFYALMRAAAWWLSAGLAGAPFFGVFSNARRRPFHDRVADTEVRHHGIRARAVAHPEASELAMGALFASVAASFFALALVAQMGVLYEHRQVALAKEKAPLCEAVTQAVEQWEGARVTRLSAALALSAAGHLEPSCLEVEADHALWTDRERLLGYLSKGVLRVGQDDEEAEKYFERVCELDSESDACKLVQVYRSAFSPERTLASIDEGLVGEQALDSLARSVARGFSRKNSKASSPDWVRLLLLRELFVHDGDLDVILALTQETSSHPLVGAKLLEYRARALWKSGKKNDSRIIVQSASDALPPVSRRTLATWLCMRELYEGPCSDSARHTCDLMERSAVHSDDDAKLSDSAFLIASLRNRECADEARRGRGLISVLADFEKRADDENGQKLFESIRHIREGELESGLKGLKDLAGQATDAKPDSFVTEANIRLLEEMARLPKSDRKASETIAEIQSRWFNSRGASRHDDWGRMLFMTLVGRERWSDAAQVGASLMGAIERDYELTARVAVAAWKAGKRTLAGEILESIDGSRLPASLERSELDRMLVEIRSGKHPRSRGSRARE